MLGSFGKNDLANETCWSPECNFSFVKPISLWKAREIWLALLRLTLETLLILSSLSSRKLFFTNYDAPPNYSFLTIIWILLSSSGLCPGVVVWILNGFLTYLILLLEVVVSSATAIFTVCADLRFTAEEFFVWIPELDGSFLKVPKFDCCFVVA